MESFTAQFTLLHQLVIELQCIQLKLAFGEVLFDCELSFIA